MMVPQSITKWDQRQVLSPVLLSGSAVPADKAEEAGVCMLKVLDFFPCPQSIKHHRVKNCYYVPDSKPAKQDGVPSRKSYFFSREKLQSSSSGLEGIYNMKYNMNSWNKI